MACPLCRGHAEPRLGTQSLRLSWPTCVGEHASWISCRVTECWGLMPRLDPPKSKPPSTPANTGPPGRRRRPGTRRVRRLVTCPRLGVTGGAVNWPTPAADAGGDCAAVIEPDGCLARAGE